MNNAGWFPVEMLVIQAAVWAGLEVAWRVYCWKVGRRVRKDQVRNAG